MCLNKISENIFVFNLKKREDRLLHIIKQLEKIGCEKYEIVESIDGNNIDNPSPIKNGAYGLVMTYVKLYEEIKNKNLQEIILIEDDCVFSENFCDEIESFYKNIPNDWSVLYFGGNHNTHVGVEKPKKINDFVNKVHNTFSAHCVVIKFEIFKKIIESLNENIKEVDVILSYLQKQYSCYTTNNKITWQINNHSDIEGVYINYDWILRDEQ
jgi:GR25 family glycosyltransferase involved in LPS biosynthesis